MTDKSRWVTLDHSRNHRHVPKPGPVIDRASTSDLMELVSDQAGCPMQVAVALVLESEPSLGAVRDAINERIRAVPRLRRRLVSAPLGCGRPIWVDHAEFDIRRHVNTIDTFPPGNQQQMLEYVGEFLVGRLWHDQPLWQATLITGLEGGQCALLVVFHHVLADGIGGLAALSQLVDGAPPVPVGDFPKPRASRRELFVDAWRSRARTLRNLGKGIRRLRAAASELHLGVRASRAPRCSLNAPTGRRRNFAVGRADLAAVREVAHQYGGTVNDVVLTAVAGALGKLLRHRGEPVERLVASVPVSSRRDAKVTQLGNEVGVMPVSLPVGGDPFRRLAVISRITRARKTRTPGASAALLAPMFRLLGNLGILRWYVHRQRLVNTFVSNVRGPQDQITFLGIPVREIIPFGLTTGNVTVSFLALSYAGQLVVSAVADQERTREDLWVLQTALQLELDTLTSRTPPQMDRGKLPGHNRG